MEQKEEATAVEEFVMGTKRIFVGGLGGSVTSEDLEKTFSSLGSVKGVEIVRTNGRSFAYMDFEPTSIKSLSKLFSMYNRCTWKGGRLRLENAKEHYLVRLKKEWEEDAELAQKTSNELDADEDMGGFEKSKLQIPEKMQLHIFFPRLRKVKALPYSGTGKHKYSFQRIEVPPLPIHFCDCEEHCRPYEAAKVKAQSHSGASESTKEKLLSAHDDQTALMNEDELNMMNSVMNNILKREVNASTENYRSKVATKGEISKPSVDEGPLGESEVDEEADEDNIVINMAGGRKSRLGLAESQERLIINQELRKQQSTEQKVKTQKGKNTVVVNFSDTTSKKPHVTTPGINRDESTVSKSKKRQHPETSTQESKGVIEVQSPERKKSIHHPSTGPFWKQKSSWKELVGETANNSFSISKILTGSDKKQSSERSNALDTLSRTKGKEQEFIKPVSGKPAENCYEPMEVEEGVIEQDNDTDSQEQELVNPVSGKPAEDYSEPMEVGKGVSKLDIDINIQEQELVKSVSGKPAEDFAEPLEVGKDVIEQDNTIVLNASMEAPSGTPFKELDIPKEAQPHDTKASNHQIARGHAWLQKSSWTELVSGTNNSFSISQVLPGVATKKQNVPNSSGISTGKASESKQSNSSKQMGGESTGNGSKSHGVRKGEILPEKVTSSGCSGVTSSVNEESALAPFADRDSNVEKYPKDYKMDTNINSAPSESKSASTSSNKWAGVDSGFGEFCPFMRSRASEKEWTKLRATLSGNLKKKTDEK